MLCGAYCSGSKALRCRLTFARTTFWSRAPPVVKLPTTALFGENAGCQEDISGATIVTDAPEQVEETDPSLIQIALDAGVAFGDFYLQGGSLNVFTAHWLR